MTMTFADALASCPVVAILRGVQEREAAAIGEILIDAGITLIEVPLNSPNPLASIAALSQIAGDRAIIGAGTVLHADEVDAVKEAGGRLIVSPNTDVNVISCTRAKAMISLPGYATPTEAFVALRAGATALKFFPAEAMSPTVLKSHLAILPTGTQVLVVGGVNPTNLMQWRQVGAAGVGAGSALYAAGDSFDQIEKRARLFARAAQNMA